MITPEKFIENFKSDWNEEYLETVFTCGNCYHFAVILEKLFGGTIYYDTWLGHFITLIGEDYYDICGKVDMSRIYKEEQLYNWDLMEKIDLLLYKRILNDCVYKED